MAACNPRPTSSGAANASAAVPHHASLSQGQCLSHQSLSTGLPVGAYAFWMDSPVAVSSPAIATSREQPRV